MATSLSATGPKDDRIIIHFVRLDSAVRCPKSRPAQAARQPRTALPFTAPRLIPVPLPSPSFRSCRTTIVSMPPYSRPKILCSKPCRWLCNKNRYGVSEARLVASSLSLFFSLLFSSLLLFPSAHCAIALALQIIVTCNYEARRRVSVP